MSSALWRVVFVVFVVIVVNLLIEPVTRMVGFPLSGDVLLILRVCLAALAIYYIVWGQSGPPS